ncbi:hypothetical protein ES703_25652 [subsurface metagenome]
MPEDGRKVAIGLGVVGLGIVGAAAAAVGVAYVLARREEELPPPPPGLANLYGIVVNSITGEIVPNALYTLNGYLTYTDPDGYYDFQNLEPGTYIITIEKENYITGSGEVTLVEGLNELNVSLTPVELPPVLASLTGLVTDAQRRPIGGAKVSLDGAIPKDAGWTTIYTITNSNGEYLFEGLEPRNYTITFEKEGYEPVTRNIAVLEDTYDEQSLTLLPPTDLVLHFTTPRFKHGFWDLRWRNLGEAEWKYGEPFGAKAQDIPCTFSPELVFLLKIMEWDGTTGACWLGPYLVEVPSLGERTWNSRAGAISGGSALELTATDNECIISGILEAVNWGEAGWGATILVDGAEDVPGKVNVGKYFIGDRISSQEQATLPRHGETGSLVIETGRRVICNANLFMQHIYPDTKRPNWKLWDFRYYPEYPPEAYVFTGSLRLTGNDKWVTPPGYDVTPVHYWEVAYSITGNISPFIVLFYGPYAIPDVPFVEGPGSGTIWVRFSYPLGTQIIMYAHPNPDAKWGRWTWELDNWQAVAGVHKEFYVP